MRILFVSQASESCLELEYEELTSHAIFGIGIAQMTRFFNDVHPGIIAYISGIHDPVIQETCHKPTSRSLGRL